VVTERRHGDVCAADVLTNEGVPTRIDVARAMAQSLIIDLEGKTVITGSVTCLEAAQEKHAENLLISRDTALAAQYTQNWQAHARHSQPYVGRGVRQ
jgi:hypothetical protein